MTAKKKKEPDYLDRLKPVEALAKLMLPALFDLSSMQCPACKSRLLRMVFIPHSAVVIECDGTTDIYHDFTEYSCPFRVYLAYAPRVAELTSLEVQDDADMRAS